MNKLIFSLEFEIPDYIKGVFPEEGETEEDYKSKEKEKELETFRKQMAKDVKKAIKNQIKPFITEDFGRFLLENEDEINIEGFEGLEDYGVKVKLKEVKSV